MEFSLYFRTLKRGWWIIVLTILVATNVSLIVSYLTPPVFQTTSRFIVAPNSGIFSNSWDVVSSLDTLDRRSIVNTYKELIVSPSIYGKDPEVQKMNPGVLAKDYNITIVVVPDTNILQLTVEGPDPKQVVVLANAIGSQALTYINKLYPVYNFSILDTPETPIIPVRPQPLQNAGLAFLFGLLIGVALAFSREQLQNTIDKLRERSIVDVASSAYTRVYFERRLLEEITQRPSASLSLGIINLRGLEEVANVLPEPIVGRVINTVTQRLKNELRGRDIVGRWGNYRLAVILPATPSSAIDATFKRIQTYLAEPVSVDNSGDMIIRPDPCIGVITRDQLDSSEEVVRRAELAVEKASALEEAAVVFLAKPFIFSGANELG